MSKGNNLQSLFCGILFCISVTALIIACLAFTKKGGGKGEYYKESTPPPAPLYVTNECLMNALQARAIASPGQGVCVTGESGTPLSPTHCEWKTFSVCIESCTPKNPNGEKSCGL